MSNDLTKAAGSSVSVPNYGDLGGVGFEDTKSSDLSIPFISILQSMSPEVEQDNPKGAKKGMLFNSVTKELFPAVAADGDKGIVVVPVHKHSAFVEWIPRTSGGGFVGMYEPSDPKVIEAIKNNGGKTWPLKIGADKNDLIETSYVYVLILDDEGKETIGFGLISFTSTKLKPLKDWITSMYSIKGRPPMFANRARIQTYQDKNKKGTYMNFSISPLKGNWKDSLISPTEEGGLLQEAQKFRKMIQDGAAKADFSKQGGEVRSDAGDDEPF